MASPTMTRLLEEREVAAKSFEDFAAPILEEKRDMTPKTRTRSRKDLRKTVKKIDERIKEVEEDETRDVEFQAARSRVLANDTDTDETPTVHVNKEPRTYGEDSPNSYYLDLCRSVLPGTPGFAGAMERLHRHAQEVAGEMRDSQLRRGQACPPYRGRMVAS